MKKFEDKIKDLSDGVKNIHETSVSEENESEFDVNNSTYTEKVHFAIAPVCKSFFLLKKIAFSGTSRRNSCQSE